MDAKRKIIGDVWTGANWSNIYQYSL